MEGVWLGEGVGGTHCRFQKNQYNTKSSGYGVNH